MTSSYHKHIDPLCAKCKRPESEHVRVVLAPGTRSEVKLCPTAVFSPYQFTTE